MKKSRKDNSWQREDPTGREIEIPDFVSGKGSVRSEDEGRYWTEAKNTGQDRYWEEAKREEEEGGYGRAGSRYEQRTWEEDGEEGAGQEDFRDYRRVEDDPPQPSQTPPSKKKRNRIYGRVAYIFSALFLSLVGYLVYFNLELADGLRSNPNNTKADEQKQYVVRGSIYTADGEIAAGTNVDTEGNEERIYPFGSLFAHVVGYTTNGKAGLEAIYNTDLLTSSTSIIDQVGKEANNEKVRGDTLYMTLDSRIQQAASSALGAYRGAVVVMEPDTGKILAMVSKPDFNPNEMAERWEYLIAEDSQSPLLNRATQGLYPPGSTFKIVTTLEYLREHPTDYTDYTWNCEGYTSNGDVTIQCYDGEVHGLEDLQGSFQHSCNTSYANLGLSLDLDDFAGLCEDLLFNGDLPTVLSYSSSQFSLNKDSSNGDVMTTSIGQGDTLVSPFHMALIVSAIANDGKLMSPYLVDRIENVQGVTVSETSPTAYGRLMTAEEAGVLTDYMRSVVEGGTASSLWNDWYTVAGKTGSAEYEVDGNTGEEENYSTHSWFVGFSNVEDPDIVVSVIAEDGGTGSSAAVPIAGAIFDAYYSYYTE